VFLAELALLAALVYVGIALPGSVVGSVVLAIVFLVLTEALVVAAELRRRPLR